MKKTLIEGKNISELRSLAKKAGITAKRDWKKADFVKALSVKKPGPKVKAKVKAKAAKPAARPSKSPAKKTTVAKPVAKKPVAKKPVAKKPVAKKPVAKKPVAKKPVVKKPVVKKTPAKKTSVKKIPAKRILAGKAAAKKTVAEKPSAMKSAVKKVVAGSAKPGKGGRVLLVRELLPAPSEYARSKVTAMPVTPGRIYVYWEITPEKMEKHRGSLNLRLVGSTGKKPEYVYLPVSERISEQFVGVSPGREYVAEMGVITKKGRFVRIVQSPPVSTPAGTRFRETQAEGERPQEDRPTGDFVETYEPASSY